jgi:hypothetical protein
VEEPSNPTVLSSTKNLVVLANLLNPWLSQVRLVLVVRVWTLEALPLIKRTLIWQSVGNVEENLFKRGYECMKELVRAMRQQRKLFRSNANSKSNNKNINDTMLYTAKLRANGGNSTKSWSRLCEKCASIIEWSNRACKKFFFSFYS